MLTGLAGFVILMQMDEVDGKIHHIINLESNPHCRSGDRSRHRHDSFVDWEPDLWPL